MRFQSTRPRGARRTLGDVAGGGRRVSIHAPTWGATSRRRIRFLKMEFQSTRPRGARRLLEDELNGTGWFQSTRPRGARHKAAACRPRNRTFQSTRPRGARRWVPHVGGSDSCFNPRAHVGRDISGKSIEHLDPVSIHAPTWGATCVRLTSTARLLCFNPRAHVGRDPSRRRIRFLKMEFQSTRPRGARRTAHGESPKSGSFNPRAHVGRDKAAACRPRNRTVSIHAPTWGATNKITEDGQ